jgi:hypothetical protein
MRYWVIKREAAYYGGVAFVAHQHWWLGSQRLAKRYTSKACAERRAKALKGARVVTVVRK